MKCYNCDAELSEKDFCTACGADVSKYKKIIYMSHSFYNDGLEKANVRDLSGAVVSLKQSLKFDKTNVEARNLLGLVYFEMGDVVGALTEWVISKNFRAKKNLADDYIEAVQSNPARLDTINQSIKKYNLALHYCYQDSKDLAVIQLKKVVAQNPHLLQARLLLSLLYLEAEQFGRARKELQKVLDIDVGNTQAMTYLKYANQMLGINEEEKNASSPKKKKNDQLRAAEGSVTYTSGNEIIIQPADVREPRGASSLLNILIGLVIGVAVSYFLILPARIQSARSEMNEELKAISDNSDTKSSRITELEQSVEALEQERDQLQSVLDDYTGADGETQKSDALYQAAKNYLDNPEDTDAVAEALYLNIDKDYVDALATDAYRQLYYRLMALVAPGISEKLFESGKTSMTGNDYTTAISSLEKAWYFTQALEQPDTEILYELGNAYQLAGESDKARATYQSIISSYPDSTTAAKAAERIGDEGATATVTPAATEDTPDTDTAEAGNEGGETAENGENVREMGENTAETREVTQAAE